VSVFAIRSKKLSPPRLLVVLFVLLVLLALLVLLTLLPLDTGLAAFPLDALEAPSSVSIKPFICAEAKVSVYAMRSKKALDVLLDVLFDLPRSGTFPFIVAVA